MAFKYFTVALLITVVKAGLISVQEEHGIPLVHAQNHHESAALYHAPAQVAHIAHAAGPHAVHLLHKQHSGHEQYPDDPHPQYNFAYNVQDALSGDSKSQSESRDGDVVHGEYSLNDADGFRRTVKYTADSVNGFNAVVEREPLTHKVLAAATPVQYHHAPSAVVAPVQYHHAPSAVVAPVQYHHAPAPAAQAYAAVPVQHHQVAAHTSYEAPHQEEQHYYQH